MDVELSRKLAERKKTEKKVDGGGDIIEVHQRLEEDVDESGNEQNNVQQLQERLWEMLINMRMKLKL